MKFGFKFSNLCGTVYKQGNVVFTPDGNALLSAVGNRVTLFDLVHNKSVTFPFENRVNVRRIALSPDSSLLLSVDDDGRALLVNFHRRTVLHFFHFQEAVHAIEFAPNGRFFAVNHGRLVQVWRTPGSHREFAPFVLHRTYGGHHEDVTSISWCPNSEFFVTCSKDNTSRLYSLDPIEDYTPVTFAAHRDKPIWSAFSKDCQKIYSVTKDGTLFVWKPKEGCRVVKEVAFEWTLEAKHHFKQHSKVSSCAFHAASSILVVGFLSGIFGIYEVPDFNNIHTLSISQHKIHTIAINSTGEWLAFGSATLGQLLVWEWQSESYVLKQQGHYYDVNALAYSGDGQIIATGGDDAKVKIWNSVSGFCFVTFSEHNAAVTAVQFSQNTQVVFSASRDGTCRAFDLVRYRNFRTFSSPSPVQFSCLVVDPSGEILCAGSQDTFEIFVWSVQTGALLDVLSGHEGPVSSLSFSPITPGLLASSSWDRSVRMWDVFKSTKATEVFDVQSEALAVLFRPDGAEIAVATMNGNITFWDVREGSLNATIEGQRDVGGGRGISDRTTAAHSAASKYFSSLCYSADGTCILAGGNTPFVCIYEIRAQVLLKKFRLTSSRALDGTMEFLNSKNMTDAGPVELIDDDDDGLDDRTAFERLDNSLPGVRSGDLSSRRVRPMARTKQVQFSPTGRAWAAASTEGLLLFSLDEAAVFDPFDIDLDVTPETIEQAVQKEEFLKALVMAFRLNERSVLRRVYQAISPLSIPLVAKELPVKYVAKAIEFIAVEIEETPHLEFNLEWCTELLSSHAQYMRDNRTSMMVCLRALQKALSRHRDALSSICNFNQYTLEYIVHLATHPLIDSEHPSRDISHNGDSDGQSSVDRRDSESDPEENAAAALTLNDALAMEI